MKKLIFGALCFALCMSSSLNSWAQDRNFDGIWSGSIKKDDGAYITVTLYIEDNTVYSVTKNDDGKRVKDFKDVETTKGHGEQLSYCWMNKGGVWTETQFYSLVWTSKKKLSVHFIRHVSNEDNDADNFIDNTDWGYTASGYLYKE